MQAVLSHTRERCTNGFGQIITDKPADIVVLGEHDSDLDDAECLKQMIVGKAFKVNVLQEQGSGTDATDCFKQMIVGQAFES